MLVAVQADTSPGEGYDSDPAWVHLWAEELSSFIPGMRVGAIQVDTQSQPAFSDGLTVPVPAAEPTETDIDKLLEDEAEEEAFRESRRAG